MSKELIKSKKDKLKKKNKIKVEINNESSKEINLKHWIILVTISLLINAYIAAMIIGIFIADIIKYKLLDEKITFKILFSN